MLSKEFFCESKISKLFFRLAILGAIGMLASAIYQTLDGVIVSYFLGETSFAALNLAFPYIIILYAVADLIGVGSSVIIAIKLGEGQTKEASKIFTNSVLTILVLESVLAIVFYFTAPYLIKIMGAEGELFDLATSFLRMYIIFLPLTSLTFAFDNYLRISGKIKTSMFLNIAVSVLIVGLECLFLGVFKLPLYGSALAASIAFTLSTIFSFIYFASGKLALKFVKPSFDFKFYWSTIKNGLPVFLSNIAGRVMAIVLNILLLNQGGENAVNAYGVIMAIDAFTLPLLYGMVDSLQPAIGFNYGAGEIKRVKALMKYAYLAALIICGVSFIITISLPTQLAAIFIDTSNLDAMKLTTTCIFIYSFTYLTRWICFTAQSTLSSLEKPISSLIISLIVSFIAPMALIGVFYSLDLTGIWLNMPVANLIATIVAILIIIIKWKRQTLFNKNI